MLLRDLRHERSVPRSTTIGTGRELLGYGMQGLSSRDTTSKVRRSKHVETSFTWSKLNGPGVADWGNRTFIAHYARVRRLATFDDTACKWVVWGSAAKEAEHWLEVLSYGSVIAHSPSFLTLDGNAGCGTGR